MDIAGLFQRAVAEADKRQQEVLARVMELLEQPGGSSSLCEEDWMVNRYIQQIKKVGELAIACVRVRRRIEDGGSAHNYPAMLDRLEHVREVAHDIKLKLKKYGYSDEGIGLLHQKAEKLRQESPSALVSDADFSWQAAKDVATMLSIRTGPFEQLVTYTCPHFEIDFGCAT